MPMRNMIVSVCGAVSTRWQTMAWRTTPRMPALRADQTAYLGYKELWRPNTTLVSRQLYRAVRAHRCPPEVAGCEDKGHHSVLGTRPSEGGVRRAVLQGSSKAANPMLLPRASRVVEAKRETGSGIRSSSSKRTVIYYGPEPRT